MIGIVPARISPVSFGTLTITGSGLTGAKAVSVEGRACANVSVASDTEIHAQWPKRVTDGKWNYSGGEVPVVVTLADDSTVSGTISYMATRDGLVVQSINRRLAAGRVGNGFFYDWSAAEICSFEVEPSSWQTGTWKKVISYIDNLSELPDSECAGFRTYRGTGRLDCAIPLKTLTNATQEASLVLADLYRALMLDISNDGLTDTLRVTEKNLMVVEGLACGSLLVAGVGYTFDLQTIENDATQNVSWTSQYGG